MSVILVSIICLGLSLLLLLLGAVLGPIRRLLHLPGRGMSARGGGGGGTTGGSHTTGNRLALVPAPLPELSRRPFDPLEQSSWHKSIREHIRYLARYVHVPPDLDEAGMPEELHRHMQVLAMLQDLFRAGHLRRTATPLQDHDQ
ncbi:hypothetical protein KR067_013149 [Drosophila pandora]|nr:hypothetical protein KR067_013149 [Drosophila pandora]